MSHEEIMKVLCEQTLAEGMGPDTILFDALIPSREEVGARFERGYRLVPEMQVVGKAMFCALKGTVKGDVHDIGKNLVNIMLEGAGFAVIDLGAQIAPKKFVASTIEHHSDIMTGGAPVTREYASVAGADEFATGASTAVRKAKELIAKRCDALQAA